MKNVLPSAQTDSAHVQKRPTKARVDSRRLMFIITVIFISMLLDQITKMIATRQLKGHPRIEYFNDIFRLQYMENPGAFLGLGGSFSESTRFWIFVACVSIIMVLMARALWNEARANPQISVWWTSGLALLFSGGMGNLVDRVIRGQGTVVDFMNIGFGDIRTGVFNIADMAILAGIFILMIQPKRATVPTRQDPTSPAHESTR